MLFAILFYFECFQITILFGYQYGMALGVFGRFDTSLKDEEEIASTELNWIFIFKLTGPSNPLT